MKIYRQLILLLTIITYANYVQSAEIVYPKTKHVEINSPKTFFIGGEDPSTTLKINGEVVNIHPSGGFNHPVDLNYGENTFTIDNGKGKDIFVIVRPEQNDNEAKKLSREV